MKNKNLRELTNDELQARHDELWKDLFGMRIKHTLGQLENPLRLRDTRRHIARVKTLLSERGVAEVARRRRVAHAGAPVAAKVKDKAKAKAKAEPKVKAKAEPKPKPKPKPKQTKKAATARSAAKE
jgi:large subunit ribosomal protein L29